MVNLLGICSFDFGMGGCSSKPQTAEYEGLMDPPTKQEDNELNLYSGLKTIDRSNSSVYKGSQHTLQSLFIQHERDGEELLDDAPTLHELLLHAVDAKSLTSFENLSAGEAQEASEATKNGKSEPDLTFPCKQNSPVSVISNLAEEKAATCAKEEAESIIRGIISQPKPFISEPKSIISEPKSTQAAENTVAYAFPEPKASQAIEVEKAEGEEEPPSAVERAVQGNVSVVEDDISHGGHLNAHDFIKNESSDVPSSHGGQLHAQTNAFEALFGHPEATHTEKTIAEAVFGQIEAVTEVGSDENTIEATDFGHIEKLGSDVFPEPESSQAKAFEKAKGDELPFSVVERVAQDDASAEDDIGHGGHLNVDDSHVAQSSAQTTVFEAHFGHPEATHMEQTIAEVFLGQIESVTELGSDQSTIEAAKFGHIEKFGSDQKTAAAGHIEKLRSDQKTIEAADFGHIEKFGCDQKIASVGDIKNLGSDQSTLEAAAVGLIEKLGSDQKPAAVGDIEKPGSDQSTIEAAAAGLTEKLGFAHNTIEAPGNGQTKTRAFEQISDVGQHGKLESEQTISKIDNDGLIESSDFEKPEKLGLEQSLIEADVGITEDSHLFDEEKRDENLALEQSTVGVHEPSEDKRSHGVLLEQSIIEGNTEANPAKLALEHNIIAAHGVSVPIKELRLSEAHIQGDDGQIEVGQSVEEHGFEHEAPHGQVELSQLAEKLGFQDENVDQQIQILIEELDLGQGIISGHIEASQSPQLLCPIAESNVNEDVVSNNFSFPIADIDVNEGVLGNNPTFPVGEINVNEVVDGMPMQRTVGEEHSTATQTSVIDYTQLGMKIDEGKTLLEASQSDPKPSEKFETLVSSNQGGMITDHDKLSQAEEEALGSNQGHQLHQERGCNASSSSSSSCSPFDQAGEV